MKLVAIIGSPRGMQGNTGIVLEGLLAGAREAGAEIETFSLAELDVQPCRSCEGCHITGECPIDDDFDTLKAALAASDGLILASPNYIMSVTAQIKAVLDRCSGLIHTQSLDGKYAAAVVTSGSGGTDDVAAYMLRALQMIGYLGVGSVGALGWELVRPETREAHLAAAKALGHELVEAIRTRRRFPEQEAGRKMIMERMQQLVTMQKDHWRFEYDYWSAREKLG